jgi:hypothetical protein
MFLEIDGRMALSPRTFKGDTMAYLCHVQNEVAKTFGRCDLSAVASPEGWDHILAYIENFWIGDRKLPVQEVRSFIFSGIVFFKSEFRKDSVAFYRLLDPVNDHDFEPLAIITNLNV